MHVVEWLLMVEACKRPSWEKQIVQPNEIIVKEWVKLENLDQLNWWEINYDKLINGEVGIKRWI